MFTNSNDPQDSFFSLKAKIVGRLRAAKVDEEIMAPARQRLNDLLKKENLLLSRAENQRLLKQVVQELFGEALKK